MEREYFPTQTISVMYDPDNVEIAKILEQKWNDNKKDDPNTKDENEASCIPEGIYIVEKQEPGFGRAYKYFRFRAIKGRTINQWAKDKLGNPMSSILIHPITYVKDLLGCLGTVSRFVDLNGDGVPDATGSKKKLEWMVENMPDVFELVIKKKV